MRTWSVNIDEINTLYSAKSSSQCQDKVSK